MPILDHMLELHKGRTGSLVQRLARGAVCQLSVKALFERQARLGPTIEDREQTHHPYKFTLGRTYDRDGSSVRLMG